MRRTLELESAPSCLRPGIGRAIAAVSIVLTLASCNSVPVSGLEKSFTLQVEQTQDTGDAVKIDFLWVIDNSASMCQEQVALAQNFKTFTTKLVEQFELDARIGVVTTDVHCDPQNPVVKASMGAFSRFPAESFPPSCHQQVRTECITDSDCEGLDCYLYGQCEDEPAEWTCEGSPGADLAVCIENPNGSINTSCKRLCSTDEECQTLFGDDRFICQKLSGTTDEGGCLLPPSTEGCPTELPPYLTLDTLDLFPCMATVGVNQLKCNRYEQGLASAYEALDPTGRNHLTTQIPCSDSQPCPTPGSSAWEEAVDCTKYEHPNEACSQANGDRWLRDTSIQCADTKSCKDQGKSECGICDHVGHLECVDGLCRGPNYGFMRDDAYLVIVFVSDEDDCSADGLIGEDYYDQCGLLAQLDKGPFSSEKGGPLTEVKTYVNRFKALKSDPSRVIVAVISGDAVPPTPEEVAANIAPTCATCNVSGEACHVEWRITEKKYVHTCSTVSCTSSTCGDTAIACSDDSDCTNTCESPSGETLNLEETNEQNPLCNCLQAPKAFDVEDYNADDPQVALQLQGEFEDGMIACMQEQYVDSKSADYACYSASYVCSSDAGIADWGTRYHELARRFGPNGIPTNICEAEGIEPALEEIANIIINIVNKICLPKHVKDIESLLVAKTVVVIATEDTPCPYSDTPVGSVCRDENGEFMTEKDAEGRDKLVTMTLGTEGANTFTLIDGGEDCKIAGEDFKAIKFNDAPLTGETVFISFGAEPELDL